MRQRIVLLLNAAILLVNFAVALGSTETQVRMARATVRTVGAVPLVRPPPPAPAPSPRRAPAIRLVKHLARLDGLDALTPAQIEALFLAHEHCWSAFSAGGERLQRDDPDGAAARALLGDLRVRIQDDVAATLRAAAVPDGELLTRLVRIVMASAG